MLRIFIVSLFYLLHVTSGQDEQGGIVVKDPSDPKYKKLAEEALEKYLQVTHNKAPYTVDSVDHVSEQVVAGTLYRMNFSAISTKFFGAPAYECYAEIVEAPWVGPNDIKVQCSPISIRPAKREVPGGIVDKDPNDPKYKELAEESMEKYLKDTHITDPYKVLSVVHVSEQVVSGLLTRIDFIIEPNLIGGQGFSQLCHSEIWEQPWINPKKIKVHCLFRQ